MDPQSQHVGKILQDLPVPAAILDVAKLEENCLLMLQAVHELSVGFRAHVKTHKTLELTRLQVGENSKDVRLIVSTVTEAESLVPLLKEFKQKGAKVNVLYGIPLGVSNVDRLAAFAREVGEGSLTVMLDNPAQMATVEKLSSAAGMAVSAFLKTDSGYHRAGVPPKSSRMSDLVTSALKAEEAGHIKLLGFYSHNSNSYGGKSPSEAMDNLREEVDACTQAAKTNLSASTIASRKVPIILSCGASPTALSIQNIQSSANSASAHTEAANKLRASLAAAAQGNISFEIHAGVYPVFDLQQVAASSRDTFTADPHESIALTIMTEVCSIYPDRTDIPEALTNAGCLALAREPCKDYRGHGVVTGWNMPSGYDSCSKNGRVIVDRVSQEHGLLQWEDRRKNEELPVAYGQRLRLWCNHACITGAMYDKYFVVDSRDESKGEIVKEIWSRWRGW